MFDARLVNQRTRWRDLVNGYDPAGVPGAPSDIIQRMETEIASKEDPAADTDA